jgi:hypothetical protein
MSKVIGHKFEIIHSDGSKTVGYLRSIYGSIMSFYDEEGNLTMVNLAPGERAVRVGGPKDFLAQAGGNPEEEDDDTDD